MRKNKSAFTIIEVVLVLTVAGLIFLVVFAAVPRLQASRRDNQRKRDVEAILTSAIDFQSNVGRHVTQAEFISGLTGSGIFADYVPADFNSPEGPAYYRAGSWTVFDANDSSMVHGDGTNGYTCSTDASRVVAGDNIAITINLERGYYCVEG